MHRSWRLRRYLSRYVFLVVDRTLEDSERSREEALFPVGFVPSYIVFDAQGREVGRAAGYSSPGDLIGTLETIGRWKERLETILAVGEERAREHLTPIPYLQIKDWLDRCLARGWVVEAARLLRYTEPAYGDEEYAAQAWRIETRLLIDAYELAAWSGRDSRWTRLELPPGFEGLVDPGLRTLIARSRRGEGPVGGELRVALRKARRRAGEELILRHLEQGLGDGDWLDLLRFASRVGYRQEANALFLRYLGAAEASRLDNDTLWLAVKEVVRNGGPEELLRNLAEEQARRSGEPVALMAQAFYLLGERERAVDVLMELQREYVGRGWLWPAHDIGVMRAAMARGEWAPESPEAPEWPRP